MRGLPAVPVSASLPALEPPRTPEAFLRKSSVSAIPFFLSLVLVTRAPSARPVFAGPCSRRLARARARPRPGVSPGVSPRRWFRVDEPSYLAAEEDYEARGNSRPGLAFEYY